MPDTLFPSGEPVSTRDNQVRWFEPFLVPPGSGTPAAAGDGVSASSAEPASRRDATAWREVDWVGFATGPDAPEESGAVPVIPAAASDDAGAADDPHGASAAAAAEAPAVPRRRRGAMRGRLRVGVGVGIVGVVAAVLYQGGERVAVLAGGMPRLARTATERPAVIAAVVPAAPTAGAATAPAPGQLVVAPTAPSAEMSGPAAIYLAHARTGDPAAQYNLAVLYVRGDGLRQDYGAAAGWFRTAALAGNVAAAFNLGVMYERGLGVERDPDNAVSWYRRAATGNYPAAEYNLAIAYAEGRGTPQNWVAAAGWYHQAALAGVIPAMVNLAILYEQGEGVARSLPDAYAWYRAAARRGDVVAAQRAHQLFEQFSGLEKGKGVMLAAALVKVLHEPAGGLPASHAAGQVTPPLGQPAKSAGRPGGAAFETGLGGRQPPG